MMENEKKISVVVPCYNVAKYLDKCVESLLQQTFGKENMEIILVDDASTDEGATKKQIMKYEKQFPDTVKAVFLPQNMRQGGARNAGITYAVGEYIIFCDADDWMLNEALEHSYNMAKKYNADIVEFARKNVCARNELLTLEKGDRSILMELSAEEQRKELLLNMLRGPGDGGSQNTLFKLSLIRDNHIFFIEHMFMEEPSFTYPAKLYAKRYYYLDEKLYVYYYSPESTVRSSKWEDRKWDNLKAWVLLTEDLERRELLHTYHQEIEYLFFIIGFGQCLQLIFQKNCTLTKEEWRIATDIVSQLFPDIRQNKYVREESNPFSQAWNAFLLQLLEMEFTEESAMEANQSMITCMKALWDCPAFH